MRTLAIVSRKGGTGKSTVTVALGVAAHLRGLRVLIADADPQGSTVASMKLRSTPGPGIMEACGGKLHQLRYASEIEGVDLLLIDTPGTADANTLHAIHASDACLVVTRPNYFDIAGAVASAATLRQLSKPGMVVINQAPATRGGADTQLVRSAREALGFTKLPVAASMLRARTAFATAVATGASPEEIAPRTPAALEVAELWAELSAAFALTMERRRMRLAR